MASEILSENDHAALWGALTERRLVRLSAANASWIPANTGEVLVVPLRGDPRPFGILILARSRAPYGLDDIEMADVLGTFTGRVVASAATHRAVPTREDDMAPSATDREQDVELAERQYQRG